MRVVIRIAACIQDGARGRDVAVDLNISFDTRARPATAFTFLFRKYGVINGAKPRRVSSKVKHQAVPLPIAGPGPAPEHLDP